MKAGDIVKYSNPEPGEESFRFVLLEHNGDRVSIQLICDHRIKPVEVVSPDEIEPAAATAVSPIDALLSLGFEKDLTGGGCSALVKTLKNGFVINLTDGEMEAPSDPDAVIEMAILTNEEDGDRAFGCRDFENAAAAIAFFDRDPMRDALTVLGELTAEDIAYAVDKDRGEDMGFAALQDLMDANTLLPVQTSDEGWMDRASAIIDAFNALVLGGDALA